MKNILVALDHKPGSNIIIEKAVELTQKFGAKLWLVHVTAPEPDFVGYDAGPQFTRDERAEEIREEHTWIQQMADEVSGQNIECEGLLVQGSTIATLLEEVNRLQADLIIVGYQEHSFLYEMWYGNNTESLLKKTTVPLLVIPIRNDD
ncbi:MAG: universal stress protein [Bacteroidia bacterium]